MEEKNARNTKLALIAQEGGDEFGSVEVWSTDSKDDEVQNPTHGGCFVAMLELSEYDGRCLMVQSEVSEQSGYATNAESPMIIVLLRGMFLNR